MPRAPAQRLARQARRVDSCNLFVQGAGHVTQGNRPQSNHNFLLTSSVRWLCVRMGQRNGFLRGEGTSKHPQSCLLEGPLLAIQEKPIGNQLVGLFGWYLKGPARSPCPNLLNSQEAESRSSKESSDMNKATRKGMLYFRQLSHVTKLFCAENDNWWATSERFLFNARTKCMARSNKGLLVTNMFAYKIHGNTPPKTNSHAPQPSTTSPNSSGFTLLTPNKDGK